MLIANEILYFVNIVLIKSHSNYQFRIQSVWDLSCHLLVRLCHQ